MTYVVPDFRNRQHRRNKRVKAIRQYYIEIGINIISLYYINLDMYIKIIFLLERIHTMLRTLSKKIDSYKYDSINNSFNRKKTKL